MWSWLTAAVFVAGSVSVILLNERHYQRDTPGVRGDDQLSPPLWTQHPVCLVIEAADYSDFAPPDEIVRLN